MKLVGMLDSPYVRRVAIALELYGVDFEQQSLRGAHKASPACQPVS